LSGAGSAGKSAGPQAVEAARLSKLAGGPVQVVWSREEEFFYDHVPARGIRHDQLRARLRQRITFWIPGLLSPRPQFADDLRRSSPEDALDGQFRRRRAAPFGTARGAPPAATPTSSPVIPHRHHGGQGGMGPGEFRLKNLADPRMARVLRAAPARSSGRRPGPRADAVTAVRSWTI